MASELKAQIFAADDSNAEVIDVPEWGSAKIMVKGMTGKDRARFFRESQGKDGRPDFEKFYAELLIATVCDPEDGTRLFEVADKDALLKKSGAVLNRISQVAMRLSGMTQEAMEEAEEDLVPAQS
jgi:hypothetical protein